MPADARQLEANEIEAIVVPYLKARKKWKREEYRIEDKGLSEDKSVVVVWAVFLEDERKPVPGGGKSVILHIDPKEGRVKKELRFQ